jgi:hypothetical protein
MSPRGVFFRLLLLHSTFPIPIPFPTYVQWSGYPRGRSCGAVRAPEGRGVVHPPVRPHGPCWSAGHLHLFLQVAAGALFSLLILTRRSTCSRLLRNELASSSSALALPSLKTSFWRRPVMPSAVSTPFPLAFSLTSALPQRCCGCRVCSQPGAHREEGCR